MGCGGAQGVGGERGEHRGQEAGTSGAPAGAVRARVRLRRRWGLASATPLSMAPNPRSWGPECLQRPQAHERAKGEEQTSGGPCSGVAGGRDGGTRPSRPRVFTPPVTLPSRAAEPEATLSFQAAGETRRCPCELWSPGQQPTASRPQALGDRWVDQHPPNMGRPNPVSQTRGSPRCPRGRREPFPPRAPRASARLIVTLCSARPGAGQRGGLQSSPPAGTALRRHHPLPDKERSRDTQVSVFVKFIRFKNQK